MALSGKERQRRYKNKIDAGKLRRLHTALPVEDVEKLDALAEHWQCSKKEALQRALNETWERAGKPILPQKS